MPAAKKILLRVPVDLHAALALEAERQGVSVNQLLVAYIAGAMGWPRGRDD
jgi:predicted HicB family RNase H-like nuclease